MSPTPPRKATRIVRLSERPSDPLDFQLNYYDYRHLRLFKDTDIHIGDELVYQVNKLGCRGPNPSADRPVIAVFGDDAVHGPLEGGFVEALAIAGFQTVNAGIEGLTLEDVAIRFEELTGALSITAAVILPPSRGLPPDEDSWRDLLSRLSGPPVVAFLPASGPGTEAFNRVLVDHAATHGKIFIPVPGSDVGWSLADRLLGRHRGGPADLPAVIAARLAKPLANGSSCGAVAVQPDRPGGARQAWPQRHRPQLSAVVGTMRQIRLSSTRAFDFGEFQMNYLNYRTERLVPSTEIYWDDKRLY